MKTYLDIYRNWRVHVLTLLTMAAVVLLFGESNDTPTLLLTKGIGFLLAYIIYRLIKWWNANGKINELMEIIDEE